MKEDRFQSRVLNFQAEISDELCEAIKQVCYAYSDRVTVATAIGCLRIAEIEIINSATDD